MIIAPFQPFSGQHCETTATGTLLLQHGISLSEPMLFGLGEGLGFIYWNMKTMDFPFIGGRVRPDELTENIAKHLHLQLAVKETSSPKKAWEEVKMLIDKGEAVGLKMDCFHLDYFSNPVHFAGHYAAIYGYDDAAAYLVDTAQQGTQVKTTLDSLARARAEKGPMSSRNLYFTLRPSGKPYTLAQAALNAMRANAATYLQPPITNISYKGILKTATELVKWFKASPHAARECGTLAMLMERAGTGGALFRNLYRDFLAESSKLLPFPALRQAQAAFADIAPQWTEVARLIGEAGQTGELKHMEAAAAILKKLSPEEKAAMEILAALPAKA